MKVKYSRSWLVLGALLAGAYSLILYSIAVAMARNLCEEGCADTPRLINQLSPLGTVYLLGMFVICALTLGALAHSAKPRGNSAQRSKRVPLAFYVWSGAKIPLFGGMPLWVLAVCMLAIPIMGRELALLNVGLMIGSALAGAVAGVLVYGVKRVWTARVRA